MKTVICRYLSTCRSLLNRHLALLAFVPTLMTGTLALPDEAHADFRVCNGTQALVGVAIGYRGEEGWITEGWWQVPATSCATLIEGALSSRYYYLYAEEAERGGRWAGDINMCVSDTEFKIVGADDCFARGHQRVGFREYDTAAQGSWMVQLSESSGASNGTLAPMPQNGNGQAAPDQDQEQDEAPDAGDAPDAVDGPQDRATGNDAPTGDDQQQ